MQCSKSSIKQLDLWQQHSFYRTLPQSVSRMPFLHKCKRSAYFDRVLNFGPLRAPAVFSPCDLRRDHGKIVSIVDSLLRRYNFNWSPQARPKSRSLKVLIFNFRSDLLMHWHFIPPRMERVKWGSKFSRQWEIHCRDQPLASSALAYVSNNISTGRIKFLSWQLEALFTLFSEFFSPFLHSTWFAIGIAPVFSLRN